MEERIQIAIRDLAEAVEELICRGVAAVVLGEIASCRLLVLVGSDELPQHVEDFGCLDVRHTVYDLIGMVEPLAHDPSHLPAIFNRKRTLERRAHRIDMVEAHQFPPEFLFDIGALDIDRVGLVKPHIEGRLHRHVATTMVVFEFVDNHAMGIDEATVCRPRIDQGGLGDDRGIADIFHAAKIRFLHADGSVAVAPIVVAQPTRLPENGILQNIHR